MQGLKQLAAPADASEMIGPSQRPSRRARSTLGVMAAAALVLPSGLLTACTGHETKEVVDVGEKAKRDVGEINKQLENRADTIDGNS